MSDAQIIRPNFRRRIPRDQALRNVKHTLKRITVIAEIAVEVNTMHPTELLSIVADDRTMLDPCLVELHNVMVEISALRMIVESATARLTLASRVVDRDRSS